MTKLPDSLNVLEQALRRQLVEFITNGLLEVIFTYLYSPWSLTTPFFPWAPKSPH